MSEPENNEETAVSEHHGRVPIRIPANMDVMLEHFVEHRGEVVGWCLLCDSAIRTEDDLLPGTDTHDCEAGRALEARAAWPRDGQPAQHQIEDATNEGQDDPVETLPDRAVTRHRCRVRHRSR
ncbi:MAG: hypothetical protein ABR881_26090 [Candidatus Sulfotelmatobacter sp.]